MRYLVVTQINNAHSERALKLRVKPRSFGFLRINTKYEATEHLILHRTKAVVALAAAWRSPPPGVLRCRFGIPGCRKYMIFGRLVNVLAAMNTSKLSCLCHQPILFRDRTQKQEMPGHRATATEITGTDRNTPATARSHLRRVTWFSARGVHLLQTGLCTRRAQRRSTAKREVGPTIGAHVQQVAAKPITPSVSVLLVRPSSRSSVAPVQPDEPVARRLRLGVGEWRCYRAGTAPGLLA